MNAIAMDIESSRAEFCHSDDNFYRTMGVPGEDTPRFPEAAPPLELVAASTSLGSHKSIDLSLEGQPAIEDLKNALQILAPTNDSLIGDAVKKLIASAIAKLEKAE